jgi:hypothetical protein
VASAWLSSTVTDEKHPLIRGGVFDGSYENLIQAAQTFDESFGRIANDAAWSTLQGRAGELPSGPFFIDETPKYR